MSSKQRLGPALAAAVAIIAAGTALLPAVAEAGCGRGGGGYRGASVSYRAAPRKVVRVVVVKRHVAAKPVAVAYRQSKPLLVRKPVVAEAAAEPSVAAAEQAESSVSIGTPEAVAATATPIEEIKATETGQTAQAAPVSRDPALQTAAIAGGSSKDESECRKFVPSVGLVVSVACGE